MTSLPAASNSCSVERNGKPVMHCVHMHHCAQCLSVANECSIWPKHFELYFKVCQPSSKTLLMDSKSMKNKTLILVSGESKSYMKRHSFSELNLVERDITNLNATRHISVFLQYSNVFQDSKCLPGKNYIYIWYIIDIFIMKPKGYVSICLSFVGIIQMTMCWAGKQMNSHDLRIKIFTFNHRQ